MGLPTLTPDNPANVVEQAEGMIGYFVSAAAGVISMAFLGGRRVGAVENDVKVLKEDRTEMRKEASDDRVETRKQFSEINEALRKIQVSIAEKPDKSDFANLTLRFDRFLENRG